MHYTTNEAFVLFNLFDELTPKEEKHECCPFCQASQNSKPRLTPSHFPDELLSRKTFTLLALVNLHREDTSSFALVMAGSQSPVCIHF